MSTQVVGRAESRYRRKNKGQGEDTWNTQEQDKDSTRNHKGVGVDEREWNKDRGMQTSRGQKFNKDGVMQTDHDGRGDHKSTKLFRNQSERLARTRSHYSHYTQPAADGVMAKRLKENRNHPMGQSSMYTTNNMHRQHSNNLKPIIKKSKHCKSKSS